MKQGRAAEDSLNLMGVLVEDAKDYKKKHCFRLRLTDGGEYMFRAKDDNEVKLWVDNLKSNLAEPESSTLSQTSRAQTLPPSSSGQEKKKGGFFTLKRK